MKTNPALLALVSIAISLPAAADTFTLKDGSTLEGVILSEQGDNYVLEINVTKTIKDERKIAKSEVTQIVREQPDEKAFAEISKSVPTPDLLTDSQYGDRITAVQKFLKDFPASSHSKEAKAMLATLKEESTQVASGGIKINGRIVSPSEYKLNAYDLDARVQEAKIRAYVDDRQFLAALRLYSDFCRDYTGTLAFDSLAPLMIQVMKNQVAEAKQLLLTLDERTRKRELGLERMTAEDRKISENAIAEETANFEARLKAEKDSHLNWVTLSPYIKGSLEETVRFGESEITRLSAINITVGNDAGKAWRDAWAIVHNSSNAQAISAAVNAARAAGVSPKYMAMLDEAAKPRK